MKTETKAIECGLEERQSPSSTPRRQGAKAPRKIISALASLRLCAFALMLLPLGLPAATNGLTSALQKGLFEEEANHNLDAAAQAYQTVSAQFDKDRKLAATAIFRLGEVYRKQGRTNEATAQYERIVREFSDQQTLVTLSRQNLAGMGVQATATVLGTGGGTETEQEWSAARVRKEIATMERELAWIEKTKKDDSAVLPFLLATKDDELKNLLRLSGEKQRRLAALKESYTVEHPEVKVAQAELVATADAINKRTDGILIGYRNRLESMRATLAELEKQELSRPVGDRSMRIAAVTDEEEKEIRRIQEMIKNSPDLINAPAAGGGLTPLCNAARLGQLRVARFLLDASAVVDLPSGGSSPIHSAAAAGHKAMVELLLEHGADANARDASGKTPLHSAAENGFQSLVEVLLARKADVNAQAKNLETPLSLAAGRGHGALVELLIARGAQTDARGANGWTALIRAAVQGHADIVTRLLRAKADPNIIDSSGRTALSLAVGNGHADTVKALLDAKADPNAGNSDLPLAVACTRDGTNIASLLLRAGADPNREAPVNFEVGFFGRTFGGGTIKLTPLHITVAKARADLAKLFLQFKADPKTRRLASDTPLIWETFGNAEFLKAFLDAGADPNADNGDASATLLYMAASVGNAAGVEALLAAGARVNPPGDARDTPLHIAVQRGDEKTIRLLLDAGAEVNRRNREGFTPLWRAVLGRKTDIAALLLAQSADPNLTVDNGSTPLHFAVSQQDRPLVQLLLTNKADVNLRDKNGKTPLDFAKEKLTRSGLPGTPPIAVALPAGSLPPPSSPMRPDSDTQPISPAALADLLRQHGAVDDLPRVDRIEIRRASANFSAVVFTKDTNDWNQFSVLELIACHYGLISDQRSGDIRPRTAQAAAIWRGDALRFPDFKKLAIHRPAADGRSWTTIPINVADILSSGDCSRDVILQWGDVVEIPEADHPVAEKWPGLADADVATLLKCVSRTVTVAINRTNLALKLSPAFLRGQPNAPIFSELGVPLGQGEVKLSTVSFVLRSVLDHSRLVRFSSDLTRVKVARRASATGQTRDWLLDCSDSSQAPDLWLRDGDVIEVPDKP